MREIWFNSLTTNCYYQYSSKRRVRRSYRISDTEDILYPNERGEYFLDEIGWSLTYEEIASCDKDDIKKWKHRIFER